MPAGTKATTPAADAAPATTKATDAAPATPVEKKERAHTAIGLHMSIPRVRSAISDDVNSTISAAVEAEKAEKEKAVAAVKKAHPKAKEPQMLKFIEKATSGHEETIKALRSATTRFGKGAPVALACVIELLLTQVITHGIDSAIKEKKKTLQVAFSLAEGCESLSLWKLISNLPCVLSPPAPAKKAAEGEAEAEAAPAEESESEHVKFKSYIMDLFKSIVKSSEEYKGFKTSSVYKSWLETLTIQFIHRLSPLLMIQLHETTKKTVDEDNILSVVRSILIDGVDFTEELVSTTVEVDHPADVEKKVAKDKRRKVKRPAYHRNLVFKESGYDALETYVTEKLTAYRALE